MASSTLERISVKMLLNDGVDAQGNTRTISVNLGSLNPEKYDVDKVLAVTEAIEGCLTKTIYHVQEVRTSTLRAS